MTAQRLLVRLGVGPSGPGRRREHCLVRHSSCQRRMFPLVRQLQHSRISYGMARCTRLWTARSAICTARAGCTCKLGEGEAGILMRSWMTSLSCILHVDQNSQRWGIGESIGGDTSARQECWITCEALLNSQGRSWRQWRHARLDGAALGPLACRTLVCVGMIGRRQRHVGQVEGRIMLVFRKSFSSSRWRGISETSRS